MLLPFSQNTWSAIIKDKISVVNATLEYKNLSGALSKTATQLQNYYIGVDTYQQLVIHWGSGVPNDTAEEKLLTQSLDALQRSMLNFALADSLIYLIAHIGNDGITVRKTDDETTIYKYQQDQLKEQLLDDAHFWLSRLLELLASNKTVFPSYAQEVGLTQNFNKPEFDWLRPAFRLYMGIDDDSFFRYNQGLICDNVATLYARLTGEELGHIPQIPAAAQRAFVYSTVADVLESSPYANLPKVLRNEFQSELIKNKDLSEQQIRMQKAEFWRRKAEPLWQVVEKSQVKNTIRSIYNSPKPNKNSKHTFTI